MEKYIRKYRVVCEFDRSTLKPIKGDMYISCANEGQIFRVNSNTLAYYREHRGNVKHICRKLINLGAEYIVDRSGDNDVLIYFHEKSISLVAGVFNALINGASINPTSIKNLRRLKWFKDNKEEYVKKGLYRELSQEEKDMYKNRFGMINTGRK